MLERVPPTFDLATPAAFDSWAPITPAVSWNLGLSATRWAARLICS